jgi:hypothetical protein
MAINAMMAIVGREGLREYLPSCRQSSMSRLALQESKNCSRAVMGRTRRLALLVAFG